MHRFFIAHASADKPWAREIAAALEPHGGAFLDEVDVATGGAWDTAILDGLYAAEVVVFLVGPTWRDAWYLREEIARAVARHRKEGVPVCVVYRDGFPSDDRKVPYGLLLLQSLDGRRADLVAALLTAAPARTPATPAAPAPAAPPPRPPASRATLHAAATALLDPQLDKLAQIDLDAPVADLRRGTRADYATDLILWADSADRLPDLEAHLRRLCPRAFR